MRKTLLATTALAAAGAFAAGPALSDDMPKKVSVGISGFMEQWVGGSSLDGTRHERRRLWRPFGH